MGTKYRINLTREKGNFSIFTKTSFLIPAFLCVVIVEAIYLFFGFYMPLQSKLWRARNEHYRLTVKLRAMEKERIPNLKEVVDALAAGRFNWTEKLTLLAEALPPEVYLTEIGVEENKQKQTTSRFLIIKGVVVSSSRKDPADAVGVLIRRLNNEDRFLQGIQPIELRSIQPVPHTSNKFMFELAGEYVRS
ncbi:MAG: hypothetical protein J7M03_06925 [Candidatus Desulfofervidaceae bacterium]|nr:hypothetical protein [Candidatus Desulfofervidaceae bacterium]MDL1969466.1 hypothetical protein [Candidatus Desulfofervidaceae bacterium]